MRTILVVMLACGSAVGQTGGQVGAAARAENEAMAATVMKAWPAGVVANTGKPGVWGYEEGVLLDGIAAEWRQTHDKAQFAYIKAAVDRYVTPEGAIQMDQSGKPFAADEHQLDLIEMGRSVLLVYRETHEEKYARAAKFLESQLAQQPRTASGGYWHKTIYPNQMWLDGAFMAEPFRAEYAVEFRQPGDFDDIAKQFLLMYDHMRDPKTGLLKHGWDESKQMPWADKQTGLSPEVWARAVGWYCVGLVDVLDWFPKGHPQRARLEAAFKELMAAVVKYQDPQTGLWWQVMTEGTRVEKLGARNLEAAVVLNDARGGNYPEASASEMFVYSLAKGVQVGLLPPGPCKDAALKGWAGIQRKFVTKNADGAVTLTGTVKVGGLGGKPYRSGTYEYYTGEKTGDQDAKGVGAYLMAGAEMERLK